LLWAGWRAPPGVRALATTRSGGVSVAPMDALNLATHVGDAHEAVAENRRRLRAAAGLAGEPRWLHQVHGVTVADLDALPEGTEPQADAAVTTRAGTACAVLTADCMPVLFAASDGSAVAAAHAGWRGLAAGVLEATVGALRERVAPATGLVSWIGPAIGARHFEVRDDVREAFLAADPDSGVAFERGREGRWLCDLVLFARRRLAALGVTDGGGGTWCTYADAGRFYSYRRDVQHRRLASTGRSATLIWRQA
jgi:purine-nucleoside/S-methyl-5'-thioadenosine phosphorylase / adenosine deaminase